MKKIVIAHIVQSTISGVTEYLRLLLPRLDNDLFENIVICPEHDNLSEEMHKIGIRVINLEMRREVSINDFFVILKLKKILKENNVDIVHAHSSKAGVVGRLAAFFARVPSIYTPHGWSFNMLIKKHKIRSYVFWEKILSHFSKKIIQVSEYEYTTAIAHGIKKSKLVVFKNAIDINRFKNINEFDRISIRKQLNIPNDAIVIGMVARLTKQKNPYNFIKIAKGLIERKNNMFFIFVGDGEFRKDIEKELKSLNIDDKFLITGWINDVEKYLAVMDIATLTSQWEGLSLTIIEYLAAKIPTVASNIGGIYDTIVDNVCGFLVDPDDTYGFIEKLERLAYNKNLREMLAKNGYEIVKENFEISRLVSQYEQLYLDIIKTS